MSWWTSVRARLALRRPVGLLRPRLVSFAGEKPLSRLGIFSNLELMPALMRWTRLGFWSWNEKSSRNQERKGHENTPRPLYDVQSGQPWGVIYQHCPSQSAPMFNTRELSVAAGEK